MKKFLSLLTILALASGAAMASDVTEKTGTHTTLKTDHSAQCSTPSAKTSRQCAHGGGTQTPPSH